jgi:hypothetical protein
MYTKFFSAEVSDHAADALGGSLSRPLLPYQHPPFAQPCLERNFSVQQHILSNKTHPIQRIIMRLYISPKQ